MYYNNDYGDAIGYEAAFETTAAAKSDLRVCLNKAAKGAILTSLRQLFARNAPVRPPAPDTIAALPPYDERSIGLV